MVEILIGLSSRSCIPNYVMMDTWCFVFVIQFMWWIPPHTDQIVGTWKIAHTTAHQVYISFPTPRNEWNFSYHNAQSKTKTNSNEKRNPKEIPKMSDLKIPCVLDSWAAENLGRSLWGQDCRTSLGLHNSGFPVKLKPKMKHEPNRTALNGSLFFFFCGFETEPQ